MPIHYRVDLLIPYPPERPWMAQELREGFVVSTIRTRSSELPEHGMGTMSSSASSSWETRDMSISKFSGESQQEKESLLSNNHTLSMLAEFQLEDITFGIFPKVGGTVRHAYDYWAKNSVGDIIEMLMQMLEALAFIHNLNIAHCDAFRDNFVIQWHPESLAKMEISPSRPRVYLIDFEVAIQFPPEYSTDQCTTTGFPIGGSFTDPETYGRPHAPEFASGKAYSAFKLYIWQLGKSLEDFKSTIPGIDEILVRMTECDPDHRMNATEALGYLRKVVHSMVPESLLIEPVVVEEH